MTVINKDYLDLQTEIVRKQGSWKNDIIHDISYVENSFKHKDLPLFDQIDMNINLETYRGWILELIDLLAATPSDINDSLTKIKETLNQETIERWVNEVLAVNEYYFQGFAEEHGINEWLPHFLAEHAIRPYLRAISEVYKKELSNTQSVGTCSCCGEPIRIARLEGKVGKKVVHCPRCYASWNEKRTTCSHCGKDHDGKMKYFHIEEDQTMQIYICEDCNGYVKVIDAKQRFKKEEPALLDLNTIHLDIIAQDRGYGILKSTETVL